VNVGRGGPAYVPVTFLLYIVSLNVSDSTVVLNRSGDVIKMNVVFREVYHRTYCK
jgi:hypothetical protein